MDKIKESKWYILILNNKGNYKIFRTNEFGGNLFKTYSNKKEAIRDFEILSKEAQDFEDSLY